MLALAVSLGKVPLRTDLPLRGDARSATCGSTVTVGCAVDGDGRIEHVGVQAASCAVGQAATALFVQGAMGLDRAAIAGARDELAAWLAGTGPAPRWPGIDALDRARAYPARHGAIMLAWNAALAALPKDQVDR
ncbi:iron-sulfur cluster assembly scaffold protein [Altererythrobacter aerius]|uniref:Iron-sulfur cluster assembly scaffold protein n=1 Tax=Tsuneonella aeria TaxID=1837929 RepID=A0A6I4TC40_9SPHN|nr:iron-sulfur cluster assembly scaffold protein [Tsuneonella aeria]